MNAQELAQWLRKEHDAVREISARMQEKVAVVPRSNQRMWIDELREAFDHLRAHHIKHIALKERDGYMLPVVERRPGLARDVDRLAHEHRELQRILDGIHKDLQELQPDDDLLIRDTCRRIQNLLSYIEHHDADENLLLLTAFTEDLGTTD